MVRQIPWEPAEKGQDAAWRELAEKRKRRTAAAPQERASLNQEALYAKESGAEKREKWSTNLQQTILKQRY